MKLSNSTTFRAASATRQLRKAVVFKKHVRLAGGDSVKFALIARQYGQPDAF
jgi:hypothetical protein